MTKITVDFFKDGGKFYSQETFETAIPAYESLEIQSLIETKFCKISEDMAYTFKAENGNSINYRLVINKL